MLDVELSARHWWAFALRVVAAIILDGVVRIDIHRARDVLDPDHDDLDKVKDRILEDLAVQKLRRKRSARRGMGESSADSPNSSRRDSGRHGDSDDESSREGTRSSLGDAPPSPRWVGNRSCVPSAPGGR